MQKKMLPTKVQAGKLIGVHVIFSPFEPQYRYNVY